MQSEKKTIKNINHPSGLISIRRNPFTAYNSISSTWFLRQCTKQQPHDSHQHKYVATKNVLSAGPRAHPAVVNGNDNLSHRIRSGTKFVTWRQHDALSLPSTPFCSSTQTLPLTQPRNGPRCMSTQLQTEASEVAREIQLSAQFEGVSWNPEDRICKVTCFSLEKKWRNQIRSVQSYHGMFAIRMSKHQMWMWPPKSLRY